MSASVPGTDPRLLRLVFTAVLAPAHSFLVLGEGSDLGSSLTLGEASDALRGTLYSRRGGLVEGGPSESASRHSAPSGHPSCCVRCAPSTLTSCGRCWYVGLPVCSSTKGAPRSAVKARRLLISQVWFMVMLDAISGGARPLAHTHMLTRTH